MPSDCQLLDGENIVDCVFRQLVAGSSFAIAPSSSRMNIPSCGISSVRARGAGTAGSFDVGGGPGSSRVEETATHNSMQSVTTSAGSLLSQRVSLSSSSIVVVNMLGCSK